MQELAKHKWLLSFLSGVLTFIAVCHINFTIAWFCLVPLFMVLNMQSSKNSLRLGLVFGLAISVFGFYWMIPGAERFTGASIFYGILAFILSAAFFAAWCGLVIFCFAALKLRQQKRWRPAVNAVLAGVVFCVGEFFLMQVSEGLPWFDFHAGNALAGNLYAIQPSAYFGVFILTFIVVLVNYLIADILLQKRWPRLWIPVAVASAYLLIGFLLLQQFEKNLTPQKEISIAILSENIPPEMKWDDNTGDMLVERLFNLNRQAVKLKPQIAMWSESAIPWTYRPDDDLVNEVLKLTAPAQITHVMGINTEYDDKVVYNSAYCILPDGKVSNRYDKQHLLTLIEKPVSDVVIPFFSSKGFYVRDDKEHNRPLNTPYGKAGIMICNEAAVPAAARSMAANGATFLCNLSNDGWFNDTYIPDLHFYNARLRAVETRKDVVVNSNNGYSGLVAASGKIVIQERSEEPYVKKVTVHPNSYTSMATNLSNIFIYFSFLYIITVIILKWLQK